MIRSALAVLAGIAVLTITSFAIESMANPLLREAWPQTFQDPSAFTTNVPASLFLYFYTGLCIICGGYITAWLAGRAPVRHAVIMGAIQTALTLIAWLSAGQGGAVPEAPLRNWVAIIALTIPAAWYGGTLRARGVR
jgi:hypothetical protein